MMLICLGLSREIAQQGAGASARGLDLTHWFTGWSAHHESQVNLEVELVLEGKQCFRIALRVSNGVVRVAGLAQVFEVLSHVTDEALVERPEVGGRMPERIRPGEVMEVQNTYEDNLARFGACGSDK